MNAFTLVAPAEAGVQIVNLIVLMGSRGRYWIPAFAPKEILLGCAGMTAREVFIH